MNILSDFALFKLRSVMRPSLPFLCGKTIVGLVMVVVIMTVVLLVLPIDSSPVVIRNIWYLEPDRIQNTWM